MPHPSWFLLNTPARVFACLVPLLLALLTTRLRDLSPKSGEHTSMTRPNSEFGVTARLNENLGCQVGVRNYDNIRTMERSAHGYTFNPATSGLPDDPAPNEWSFYNDYAPPSAPCRTRCPSVDA